MMRPRGMEEAPIPPPELRAGPYPAPLGRVISLGDARVGSGPGGGGIEAVEARGQIKAFGRRPSIEPPAIRAFSCARATTRRRGCTAAHTKRILCGNPTLAHALWFVPNPAMAAGGGGARSGAEVPSECCVEVNLVRPTRGRWLLTLRRLFGHAEGPALTATFLASTPSPV